MDGADLFNLFLDDEPSAQERAQAMAQALRRQQAAGALGMLTGDKVLSQFGGALMQGAGRGEGVLAEAGQSRAGARLRSALESAQRRAQEAAARLRREQELQDQTASRAFQAQQGALNRASQERAAGLSHSRQMDRTEAKEAEDDVAKFSQRTEGSAAVLNDIRKLKAAAARKDVPGVSKGYRFVPDFMEGLILDDDELSTRQAARGTVGNLLKMRSGTAASDAEVNRVMAELGMGPNASEEEFRIGLQRLEKNFGDELGQKAAAMRPEAQRRARERGLIMPEAFREGPAPAGEAPRPSAGVKTVVDRIAMPDGKTVILYSDGSEETQ